MKPVLKPAGLAEDPARDNGVPCSDESRHPLQPAWKMRLGGVVLSDSPAVLATQEQGARAPGTLGAGPLAALGLAALVPRLASLGSYSMWLDEILQTEMASGSFGELLRALARDRVHPPLDGALTWLLLQAGFGETLRRLLAVLLGVATVVLLARWLSERFGSTAGLLAGVLAALSPVHIHYSQELRPYALALLWVVSTLWLFDRWLIAGPSPPLRVAGWTVTLVLALYTLYWSAAVVAPMLLLWVLSRRGEEPVARWRRFSPLLFQGGIVFLALLPWGLVLAGGSHRAVEASAEAWTLPAMIGRFQRLTVGGLEGSPLSAFGVAALLPALLILIALGRTPDRVGVTALLVGALSGSLAVELVLLAADHWTNDRYSLMAWPFLVALEGIGASEVLRWLGRRSSLRMSVALAGVLLLPSALAVHYWFIDVGRGRPNWRHVASLLESLLGPQDRLYVSNDWTRLCLQHYLPALEPLRIETVVPAGDFEEWALSPPSPELRGCRYLVDGGYPSLGEPLAKVLRTLPPSALLLTDPGGLGSRLVRLDPFDAQRPCRWLVPSTWRQRPLPFGLARPQVQPELEIPFDASSVPHLLSGWSGLEVAPDGRTFAWAEGLEAFVALPGVEPQQRFLRLTVVTYESPQTLAVTLNGQDVGSVAVAEEWSRVTLPLPATLLRSTENLLGFTFTNAVSPASENAQATDQRRLSVAFDEIALDEAQ